MHHWRPTLSGSCTCLPASSLAVGASLGPGVPTVATCTPLSSQHHLQHRSKLSSLFKNRSIQKRSQDLQMGLGMEMMTGEQTAQMLQGPLIFRISTPPWMRQQARQQQQEAAASMPRAQPQHPAAALLSSKAAFPLAPLIHHTCPRGQRSSQSSMCMLPRNQQVATNAYMCCTMLA
jgi:hypothetical protein